MPYVINFDPDHEHAWLIVDTGQVIERYIEFDDALLRLRQLRGDLAVGDHAS